MIIKHDKSRPAPPQKCGGSPTVLWRGHYTASLSNSNGGQVMPALSAVEYKMGQQQKDTGGGYVLARLLSCKEAL